MKVLHHMNKLKTGYETLESGPHVKHIHLTIPMKIYLDFFFLSIKPNIKHA